MPNINATQNRILLNYNLHENGCLFQDQPLLENASMKYGYFGECYISKD